LPNGRSALTKRLKKTQNSINNSLREGGGGKNLGFLMKFNTFSPSQEPMKNSFWSLWKYPNAGKAEKNTIIKKS
jgi:hypothetical protein